MSRKQANTVIPEAVRWFNRFRMKGPTALSPDESSDWARWSANAGNLAEFRRARQVWKNLSALSTMPRPSQIELDADHYDVARPVSEWLGHGKRRRSRP
jgi:ferric-dicitrate binding protein FerR (iron transport regulator)